MNGETRPTLPAKRSGSPDGAPDAIDVLFGRMAARYGRHWLDLWIGIPMDAVKAEWRCELARFQRAQVDQALANLGKFPPTLPEFVGLCAQFKPPRTPAALQIVGPREPVKPGTFQRLRDVIGRSK